ncbi:MAG: histidine triad nucleotide-binding protein [Gammaproteobacteria bacterium]
MDCLFCKVADGTLPAEIIYRDEFVVAFNDINPQAPYHVLIIPHKHVPTLNELGIEDNALLGHMAQTAKMLAKQFNIAEQGYRIVMNCNAGAGQTVFHIHLHLLGGRRMSWPPG